MWHTKNLLPRFYDYTEGKLTLDNGRVRLAALSVETVLFTANRVSGKVWMRRIAAGLVVSNCHCSPPF